MGYYPLTIKISMKTLSTIPKTITYPGQTQAIPKNYLILKLLVYSLKEFPGIVCQYIMSYRKHNVKEN